MTRFLAQPSTAALGALVLSARTISFISYLRYAGLTGELRLVLPLFPVGRGSSRSSRPLSQCKTEPLIQIREVNPIRIFLRIKPISKPDPKSEFTRRQNGAYLFNGRDAQQEPNMKARQPQLMDKPIVRVTRDSAKVRMGAMAPNFPLPKVPLEASSDCGKDQ